MKFTSVGITCKSDLDDSSEIIEKIVDFFADNGCKVSIDERVKRQAKRKKWTNTVPFKADDKCKLIIVLGGDGTMLRAIRENFGHCSIYFGINMGRLGFLAEISPKELEKTLNKIIKGKFQLDERSLLDVKIVRKGKEMDCCFSLNEVVINQCDVSRLIKLRTEVNRKVLTSYYADGLIIATPTGSTAYNLSAGGPLLHPEMEGIIITPIAPHSLTQKPIVIPNNKRIQVYTDDIKHCLRVTSDGQESVSLKKGDIIKITGHKKKVSFLRLMEESYYKTLRRKLHWGERKAIDY